ncbi:MAG: sigma-70 family RNA polymerase sigma factor [Solirubrobacteraceae bacterium]|nr:sigma-70 family RNA polymerase sigma factor [Solirubrobacteraceae bacterium]
MATVQERPGDEAAEPSPVALLEDGPARTLMSEADAEQLVLTVLGRHADSLLRTARTHSLNADDAQDAYQRGLEIFLRHVRRLDPARAHSWLHQVIKHEAMAVRKGRQRELPPDEIDLDARESEHVSDPADALLRIDRVQRSAAALQQLKPQEVQALWLKASGHSYEEIAERQQWSRTKVNRCLTEGRKAFLGRYAELESGEQCERWAPALSALLDGEAKAKDAQALRGHLRSCPGCRATLRALHEGGGDLRVLFPVPLVIGQQAAEHHDATANLALRVYEAIVGGVHERASASVMRMHAFVEAASATKVAAVAASAAVVAGGGTVAVDQVRERDGEPPVERAAPAPVVAAAAAAPPASAPVRATAATSVTRVAAASKRAAERDVARERAAARARARARAAARERAAERRAAQRRSQARAAAAAAPAPASAPSGAEFSLGAPAPAPTSGTTGGGGTSGGSSSSASAGAEFGP